jgi:phosphatidylglycerophosphatase A
VDRAARLIATFFGAGLFPVAPATFASAIVAAILFGLGPGADPAGHGRPLVEGLVILALLPIAIFSAHQAEKTLGHDASPIVIDEVVGQMIALWWVPRSWPWVLAGFLLFRLFDIWKPLGAREAQRLPGGWGIVIDDVLAGLYALGVLQVALRVL